TTTTTTTTTKDSTMDNLIALFREQTALLAAASQGNPAAIAGAVPVAQTVAALDATAVGRAEIARVSGFPDKALRPTPTIAGDLGFDSIMVTDLFSGLTRKIPGMTIDARSFGPATTIADVIAMAGGQVVESAAAPEAPTVTPQVRISEFEEVKALADRKALVE